MKKAYETPEFEVHGSVQDLTQSALSSGDGDLPFFFHTPEEPEDPTS